MMLQKKWRCHVHRAAAIRARAGGIKRPMIFCSGVPAIEISDLVAIGHGIERPEQVLVTRDDRVYASDKASAVARVRRNGELQRIGHAGGEPNGIAMQGDGSILIANFGLGALQELDPATGSIRTLLRDMVGDLSLQWINYVLVDSSGALWVSVCSQNPDLRHTLAHGTPDGYLFRMSGPDSVPYVVADMVNFPNCMALDEREEYLYVVRTLKADVVRFARRGTGLGPEEQFSPPLGDRRDDEYGEHAGALLADRAVTRRWGMADGCAFDAAGNLWVTLARANRIVAVTPDRRVLTIAEDPGGTLLSGPTSIAWGGSDMCDVYIGSLETPYILRGRSSRAGMPMVHQRERGTRDRLCP
jgi:sugar lactone lactonase YvrE